MINVLYHANCADGFTAAWLLARRFGENNKFFPMHYGDPFPAVENGDIYIVDFCCEIPEHITNNVYIFDHHIGAKDLFDKLRPRISADSRFDLNECGASLVHKYLAKGYGYPLVRYVKDRDLWTWALPYSRQINAVIQSATFTFITWDILSERVEDRFDSVMREGQIILDTQDKIIKDTKCEEINGIKYVNTHCLKSEVGNHYGPGPVIVWHTVDGFVYGSVRGKGALEIAKKFGGGGHALAAGFKCTLTEFINGR